MPLLEPGQAIIDAYFYNNERDVVKVIYWEPETDIHRNLFVRAEEDNVQWQQLLEWPGISIDKLHENTYNYIKQSQLDLEQELIDLAKEKGWLDRFATNNEDSTVKYVKFATFLLDNQDEEEGVDPKETLFLYKLALFESEIIKNSTNRKLKTELRRAKNIIETTKIACEIALGET